MIKFVVLTLFPDMIQDAVNHSILKRAMDDELIEITTLNIRDFAQNKHRQVDDMPYGGGPGMVMMVEPISLAIEKAKNMVGADTPVFFMSPRGERFTQEKAKSLSQLDKMIILCGHYEGVDERVIDGFVDEEISLGDFILTGGEISALAIIDAVSRLHENVLQNNESIFEESFENYLLEYPQYTRPQEFRGIKVPEVLLSGHHENIELWRKEQALSITKKYRPDLFVKHEKLIQEKE